VFVLSLPYQMNYTTLHYSHSLDRENRVVNWRIWEYLWQIFSKINTEDIFWGKFSSGLTFRILKSHVHKHLAQLHIFIYVYDYVHIHLDV